MDKSAKRGVAERYHAEHLVETVGQPVAVLLADVLRVEVRGDEREQLLGVSVFQQVYYRACDVAVVHDFGRFPAHVLYGEHRRAPHLPRVRLPHHRGDVLGIHYAYASVFKKAVSAKVVQR